MRLIRIKWLSWLISARAALPVFLSAMLLVAAMPAKAVPSFADQTGQPCQACHVGGFGPQLTPFGREFKLNGYTMRAKSFNVPIAAMAIASYSHTNKDQIPAPDNLKSNNNVTLDQVSAFVAGGVGQHFGGFAQITYDGVGHQWGWDNLDLRAVTTGQVLGQDAVFGLDLNNNPTVQDVWNTAPAWGFPYSTSPAASSPGAAPLIDGALAQNVIGVSAYSWIGHKFYIEAGGYSTPASGTLSWLGADPSGGLGDIHGLAPYGRVAWQRSIGAGTLELGAFALKAAIFPARDRSTGLTDRYSDTGLDASYQRPDDKGNILSGQVRYTHEAIDLRASCLLGGLDAGCAHSHLNELRGDVGYTWHGKVGMTLGAFTLTGSDNTFLYSGPTPRPNSNGVMTEVDYTPWGNGSGPLGPLFSVRFGAQFTAYGTFNGTRHNYDGMGANASDNNTFRIFSWLAF